MYILRPPEKRKEHILWQESSRFLFLLVKHAGTQHVKPPDPPDESALLVLILELSNVWRPVKVLKRTRVFIGFNSLLQGKKAKQYTQIRQYSAQSPSWIFILKVSRSDY